MTCSAMPAPRWARWVGIGVVALGSSGLVRAQPPAGTPMMNQDARRSFLRARALLLAADRDRGSRRRYERVADLLQQNVKKWPQAETTPEALDTLGFVLWARLDDPAAAVAVYARSLELQPLSEYAERAAASLAALCFGQLKQPRRARELLQRYSSALAVLLRTNLPPEQQAQTLFLKALTAHLLGTPDADAQLREVGKRFPDSEWAKKAESLLALTGLSFAARLRTFQRVTYYCDERDLGPRTPLEREWGRKVQVQPISESPVLLNYELTLSTTLPVTAADPPTAIHKQEGRWTAAWSTSDRVALQHCGRLSFVNYEVTGYDHVTGAEVAVRRRSERLPSGRRRLSVLVQAPTPVYVDVMMGYGVKADLDTVSPKPVRGSSASFLAFWGGSGRTSGMDCRGGRTFSFEVEVPPSLGVYYPQVIVGTWKFTSPTGASLTPAECGMAPAVPPPSAAAKMTSGPAGNLLRFHFADTDVLFSSPVRCRVARAEHNIRCWYTLGTLVERIDGGNHR